MQKKLLIILSAVVVGAMALLVFNSLPRRSMSESTFCTGPLSACVGKKVKLTGELTDEVMQSMGGSTGGFLNTHYFKLADWGPVVIHSKSKIAVPSGTKIEVIATVSEVRGGGPGQKLEEETVEYQLLVEEWKKVE